MFSLSINRKFAGVTVLSLALVSSYAMAAAGGNGPGNGTDSLASDLALKVLSSNDGLSVEEKIYNLWVKAENSVPNVSDSHSRGVWFGLKVANEGAITSFPTNTLTSVVKEKYQKMILHLEWAPALAAGPIVIKPSQGFGFFFETGNYDGDMDPAHTIWGTLDGSYRLNIHDYDGRPDLNGGTISDPYYSIKPVIALSSGLLVQDASNFERLAPVEYRQLDAMTLVGVRMVRPSTDIIAPCPDAKK